ncbi:MAG: hypothetical protein ACM3JI_01270, partial [Anaerolineae bacterium]
MPSPVVYHPKIFSDFSLLKNFFSGKEEIKELCDLAQKVNRHPIPPFKPTSSWSWIAKGSFDLIATGMLLFISKIADLVQAKKFAIYCSLSASHHMSHVIHVLTYLDYEDHYLAPSINACRISEDEESVYLSEPP